MRVSLITTGVMEFKGFSAAFQKLFPGHQFLVERSSSDKGPFDGFTSNRVLPLSPRTGSGKVGVMLRAALGTLIPSDAATLEADFAIIVDDLELNNKGNEFVVVEHVRESARRIVAERSSSIQSKALQLLRTRVSFHLAVPMPESWFFGDFSALQTEVPEAQWPPKITANRDPEDFFTDDAVYDADNGAACKGYANGKLPSWVSPRRTEHPKKYLEWLMRDVTAGDCSRYLEQHEGARLLGKLDWPTVLGTPTCFPYLRALLRDLENALETSAVGIPAGGVEAPLTSIRNLPSDPLLRNI